MKKLQFGSIMAFLCFFILISVDGQEMKKETMVANWNTPPMEKTDTEYLEKLLFELPDVIFKKAEPSPRFKSTYLIRIKQPVDHSDLTKGFFYQKVYLTHKGFDRPTVIVTEGYGMWENSDYELTELLNANQIKVEHRYYGDSNPDTMNYSYLNLEQATADLHYVRQLFSDIYMEKWISTGISKGGATAIVYRYFYPEDIDVCVPYVAPINNSLDDQRYKTFLDTIGNADCREKIKSFQIKLLENRDRILPLLKFYCLGTRAHYNYLTIDQAFELAVLEYPYSFWQYVHNCEEIPDNEESLEKIVKHFISVPKITWYSDEFINNFGSWKYQKATEFGGYRSETKDLKNLLVALPAEMDSLPKFIPGGMSVKFDGKLMNDVIEWLNIKGDKFIYIYGATDIFSAAAVTPNKNVDSKWFFMRDKSHEDAVISEMTDMELKIFISTLENWLSLDIENVFHNKE